MNSGPLDDHTRITLVVQNEVLDMSSDHTPVRYSFSKSIKVRIPSREEWDEGKYPLPPRVWYSRSSKVRSGNVTGILVVQAGVSVCFLMGVYTSVFQTKAIANTKCARENLGHGLRDKSI